VRYHSCRGTGVRTSRDVKPPDVTISPLGSTVPGAAFFVRYEFNSVRCEPSVTVAVYVPTPGIVTCCPVVKGAVGTATTTEALTAG
jgi:hypothetical protein